MRIWMAAGLAAYLALNAFETPSEGMFWHGALGWLQPDLATPVGEAPVTVLSSALLYREAMGHAAD